MTKYNLEKIYTDTILLDESIYYDTAILQSTDKIILNHDRVVVEVLKEDSVYYIKTIVKADTIPYSYNYYRDSTPYNRNHFKDLIIIISLFVFLALLFKMLKKWQI